MKLFLIQDDDEDTYILATDYVDALEHWQKVVAEENDGAIFEPNGIQFVARDVLLSDSVFDSISEDDALENPPDWVVVDGQNDEDNFGK